MGRMIRARIKRVLFCCIIFARISINPTETFVGLYHQGVLLYDGLMGLRRDRSQREKKKTASLGTLAPGPLTESSRTTIYDICINFHRW